MNNIKKKKFNKKDISIFLKIFGNEKLLSEEIKKKNIIYWKFCKNPNGKSNYFFIKKNKDTIGRILSSPYASRVFLNGKSYKSFLLSDLLVKKQYRFPLNNLINLYLFCIKKTPGIVLHSSNSNSENFYKKILKKIPLFNLISYGFPLTFKPFKKNFFLFNLFISFFLNSFLIIVKFLKFFSYIFSGIKYNSSKLINYGEDLTSFCYNIKKKNNIFKRGNSFLKWRYEIYKNKKIIKFYKKNNELLGYVIFVVKNELKLKNLIVMDFLFKNNISLFEKIFIRSFLYLQALQFNCDTIFLMGNIKSDIYRVIAGLPFVRINDFFLPHSNPMFISNFNKKIKNKLEKINFTPSDFDYF